MPNTAGEAAYKAVEQQTRFLLKDKFDSKDWPMWHELPAAERMGWETIAAAAIDWYKGSEVFHSMCTEPCSPTCSTAGLVPHYAG